MKNNPSLFDVIQNLSISNMNIENNGDDIDKNKNHASSGSSGTGMGLSDVDQEELAEMLELAENELTQEATTKISEILAIMGICICMIGIVGNFFSIIVLNRKSMKKLSTYAYLLGLSICDEICLISTVYTLFEHCLPRLQLSSNTIYLYKKSLIYVIPIPQTFQALSVWITMAFTFDRYLYVCQPFYGRKYCTRKRAFFVLICLYTLAFIYSIPQFFERKIVTHEIFHGIKKSYLSLSEFGEKRIYIKLYHGLIYCAFVVFIPFTTIVILNGFLVYDIIKSNKRHRGLSLNYRPSVSIATSNLLMNRANSSNSRRRKSLFLKCLLNRKSRSNSNNKILLENKTNNSPIEPCLPNNNNNNRQPSLMPSSENQTNHRLSYDKYFTLRNDVTIMLIGLIVVFLICQFPSTILRLVLVFNNLTVVLNRLFDLSLNVSNFLVVTSSTLNCILYVMLGKKFRKEFLATFSSKCCCKNNNQNDSFNYNNNNNNNRILRPSISVNVNNQI